MAFGAFPSMLDITAKAARRLSSGLLAPLVSAIQANESRS